MREICGIYCIENIVNGKKYIGQSKNIEKRWKSHIIGLTQKDTHVDNQFFIDDWWQYGKDNFNFYIVEQCDPNQLNERESYWINYYNSISPNGYNQTMGGMGGNTIINYSDEKLEEYKQRKRILHKLTAPKCEDASRAKLTNEDVLEIVKCFQNGEYDAAIAKKFNISVEAIRDIRLRKTWASLTAEYQWEKSDGRKLSNLRYKPVDMYTKDGQYIQTFDNARIAEECTGVGFRLISAVCNGTKMSAKGYVWRFTGHRFDEFNVKLS